MAWFRALLAAIAADNLNGKSAAIFAGIVAIVPFGWILLLLRWSPIRRALRGLPDGIPPF